MWLRAQTVLAALRNSAQNHIPGPNRSVELRCSSDPCTREGIVMDDKDIETRKRELRQAFRRLRKDLGFERRSQADDRIREAVLSLREYIEADVVLTYLDVGAEVRTRGIVRKAWEDGKTVAMPWCVPHTRLMRWFCIDSFDGLVRSDLGVLEPDPQAARELPLDAGSHMLALVPGLTFDVQGYRLGYGGGFYDTFLSEFCGFSVGLCREAQMSDGLLAAGVVDSFDMPVNVVVTDQSVYTCTTFAKSDM